MNIEQIGTNNIMADAVLNGCGTLLIGPWSWISYGCYIEAHTHNFNEPNWPVQEFEHILVIKGQVYIGARAMILGNCRFIAEGVLIGAGSVVTKNITEPWTVWAGNPARKIKNRTKIEAMWT